jgi:hypothetical protein
MGKVVGLGVVVSHGGKERWWFRDGAVGPMSGDTSKMYPCEVYYTKYVVIWYNYYVFLMSFLDLQKIIPHNHVT